VGDAEGASGQPLVGDAGRAALAAAGPVAGGLAQVADNSTPAWVGVSLAALARACNGDPRAVANEPESPCVPGSIARGVLDAGAAIVAFVEQERASLAATCVAARSTLHPPLEPALPCEALAP
jgi:hypothetical protein